MTPKEFMQGWALLLAQPYGVAYRREADVEKAQRLFWLKRFASQNAQAWAEAIGWWINHEDHFPLVPEMDTTIRRHQQQAQPAPAQALTDGVSVPVDQGDLLAYAIEQNVSVFEAVRRWRDVEAWKHGHQSTPKGGRHV